MTRFNFENALMWVIRAPHAKSFFWQYALAYTVVASVFLALIGALVYITNPTLFSDVGALESALDAAQTPQEAFAILGPIGMKLLPAGILLALGSWIIWAMFEAASQRRYVRGEGFSLGFGMDELRLMWVGLLYGLLSVVLFAPVVIVMLGAVSRMFSELALGTNEEEVFREIAPSLFGAFGMSIPLFLIYTFFATRLAPCFGLTIKDRAVRFFDAWNVSRGRFWPILGAFLIVGFVTNVIIEIIGFFLQLLLIPAMSQVSDSMEPSDFPGVFLSPGVLIPLGIFVVLNLALQGLAQHSYGAPAAFAARKDPRRDADDEQKLDTFS